MSPIGPAETLAYLGIVVGVGMSAHLRGRGQSDGFFLGHRGISAWSACLSLVATELTVVVFIALTGSSLRGDHTAFQLVVGYLIGRVIVAFTLLSSAFNGTQFTAYQRLHMRFGLWFRRLGATLFFAVRILRDTAVLAASIGALVFLTDWSPTGAILAVGAVAACYMCLGGLRAVVSMDLVHLAVMGLAGLFVLVAAAEAAGGLGSVLGTASAAGKLRGINWSGGLGSANGLFAGIVGGAAWSAASYSVDHITVQRLLATGSIAQARRALIGTGVAVMLATSFLLTLGTVLWAMGPTTGGDVVQSLVALVDRPLAAGLRGWVAAGVFGSATSVLAASAISLGSSTVYDVVTPSIDGKGATASLLASRLAAFAWLLIILCAVVAFQPGEAQLAFGLDFTSVVYGVLLGIFVVGSLRRADPMRGSPGSFLLQRLDAWVALTVGAVCMTWLTWWPPTGLAEVGWIWRVPVGALLTVLVGLLVRTLRKAVHDPTM